MQSAASPDWMTLPERVTEAAAILAGGIVRLRRREVERIRRSRLFSGDGLDLFLEKSVHCNNKELPKGESR